MERIEEASITLEYGKRNLFTDPWQAVFDEEQYRREPTLNKSKVKEWPVGPYDTGRSAEESTWRKAWEDSVAQITETIEINYRLDLRQRNRDIPPVQAFLDMGLDTENPDVPSSHWVEWLEDPFEDEDEDTGEIFLNGTPHATIRRRMDDAHFRECCVVRGNRLHAFHIRSSVEEETPWYLRPETIQRWLDCEFEDAESLSRSFKALNLDQKAVIKVVFGYMPLDGEWKTGIKAADDPEFFAEFFEDLAKDANEDGVSLESMRKQAYTEIRDEFGTALSSQQLMVATEQRANARWKEHLQMRNEMEAFMLFDDRSNGAYRAHSTAYQREMLGFDTSEFDDGEFGEDPDFSGSGSLVFSTHPLFDGSESLRHEFLTFIKSANYATLQKLKSMMFSQKGYPARFWFFTNQQKAVFWRFVKDREAEIAQSALKKCSESVKETRRKIMAAASGTEKEFKQVSAYLWSHVNGKSFTDWATYKVIEFETPSSEEQALLAWTYNQVKKAA